MREDRNPVKLNRTGKQKPHKTAVRGKMGKPFASVPVLPFRRRGNFDGPSLNGGGDGRLAHGECRQRITVAGRDGRWLSCRDGFEKGADLFLERPIETAKDGRL